MGTARKQQYKLSANNQHPKDHSPKHTTQQQGKVQVLYVQRWARAVGRKVGRRAMPRHVVVGQEGAGRGHLCGRHATNLCGGTNRQTGSAGGGVGGDRLGRSVRRCAAAGAEAWVVAGLAPAQARKQRCPDF
eukprot:363047-Chlamydomonas_euryale.AAC.8